MIIEIVLTLLSFIVGVAFGYLRREDIQRKLESL